MKRSEKQGREGKVHPIKHRVPKNSLKRQKAFFNEQCLIIENNKRGTTGDLFRKTGNIKGTFCPKMVPIKDKNGRDLVEAEEIKKRWTKYTKELYKKYLNEPDDL